MYVTSCFWQPYLVHLGAKDTFWHMDASEKGARSKCTHQPPHSVLACCQAAPSGGPGRLRKHTDHLLKDVVFAAPIGSMQG